MGPLFFDVNSLKNKKTIAYLLEKDCPSHQPYIDEGVATQMTRVGDIYIGSAPLFLVDESFSLLAGELEKVKLHIQ